MYISLTNKHTFINKKKKTLKFTLKCT